MAEMKIKEVYNLVQSPFVLDTTMTYPTIEGNTSNFLTDYTANKEQFDAYFLKEHGKKLVDLESEEDADIILEWKALIISIQRVYLNAWAHIYYTLDIAYNPVYNVEEHTSTKYGQHETDVQYGQHETEMEYGSHVRTNAFGATQDTFGTHTDTSTDYSVAYDSGTEKETGKTSNETGQQINSSLAHTDTETSQKHTDTNTSKLHTDTTTSKQHTDTVDRTGNIGVISATKLADDEVFMREKQIFFKNIFLTISREVGAYYECTII